MAGLDSSLVRLEEVGKLDNICKSILSKKQVLARILKGTIEAYENYSAEEIAEKFIEGEPKVNKVPVHRDEITGMNTEDNSETEGEVRYDVLFKAKVPDFDKDEEYIVNVESQGDYYTKYPLLSRAVYYCGRLLSAQKDREFSNDNYQDIRKVHSIWVCLNGNDKTSKANENTIASYVFTKKDIYGKQQFNRTDYDLVEIIMICLGDEEKVDNELLACLGTFFSSKKDAETKKRILHDEHGIIFDSDIEREVDNMCNYGEYVLEKGEENATVKLLKNIMKNLNLPIDKALVVAEVPEDKWAMYKQLVLE